MEAAKGLARIFKRKPQIVNLSGEELKDKAIFLSNHAGAHGPMTYEMFFPKRVTPWGAHEMKGNYRQRWNYLYHVFYRQKLHWSKFKSFVVATLFAPISILLYRGVGLIGTYTDGRVVGTLKTSCRVLDKNSAIILFPEDSSKGYIDPPPSFHLGFVTLAKMYKKARGEDLPVYVCYCHAKKRRIVISKPIFVNEMLKNGATGKDIANEAVNISAELYENYILQDNGTEKIMKYKPAKNLPKKK